MIHTVLGRRGLRGALFLLLPLLLGCASPRIDIPHSGPDIPARAAVEGVPLIEQADFYCGPAALAMVHQWAGLEVSQTRVAAQSFTPAAKGTYLADMLGSTRRFGQLAIPVDGFDALLKEVSAGNPVIVFQNLGLGVAPRWHYAVVVGYDLAANRIELHSGQHRKMVMQLRQFERTWARGDYWAITVLPPDRLPSTADPWEIAKAAAALERAGKPGPAAQTYAAAARRWPKMWVLFFGLGNARYAQGDLRGAISAYQRALALDPTIAEVKNNLAEVQGQLG